MTSETLTGSIVPYCHDLDPHIIQYADKFTLTQLVSVNKRFADLIMSVDPTRKIAAPNGFTWFIAAIMAGSMTAVDEYHGRFPDHVSPYFSVDTDPKLFIWTSLSIPGKRHYQHIRPIDVAVETKNEDMVLLLLSKCGGGLRTYPGNYMFMPRVVARHCDKIHRLELITWAFENGNLEFLDKIHELIPEIVRHAAAHDGLQHALTDAQHECNFAKCKWAIDHDWVPLNNVLRIFNQRKRRDLAAALKKVYHG